VGGGDKGKGGLSYIYLYNIYVLMHSYNKAVQTIQQISLSFLAKDSIYKALNVCSFVGFLLGLS